MGKLRFALSLVLLVVLALFVLLNLQTAHIHILIGRIEMPVGLAILFSAVLGAGAVAGLRFLRQMRRPPSR